MTDYDELRRLAAAASAGSWEPYEIEGCFEYVGNVQHRRRGFWIPDAEFLGNGESHAMPKENADFICAARTAIPELLDALEAAPAWRKHPTCPGLWVFDADQSKRWSRNAYVLSDGDIENFDIYGFPKTRCYGPIPNPPEETTT